MNTYEYKEINPFDYIEAILKHKKLILTFGICAVVLFLSLLLILKPAPYIQSSIHASTTFSEAAFETEKTCQEGGDLFTCKIIFLTITEAEAPNVMNEIFKEAGYDMTQNDIHVDIHEKDASRIVIKTFASDTKKGIAVAQVAHKRVWDIHNRYLTEEKNLLVNIREKKSEQLASAEEELNKINEQIAKLSISVNTGLGPSVALIPYLELKGTLRGEINTLKQSLQDFESTPSYLIDPWEEEQPHVVSNLVPAQTKLSLVFISAILGLFIGIIVASSKTWWERNKQKS